MGSLHVPRLVVAGLSGDSGKTLVSIGLGRSLSAGGLEVRPYKKGPDYIDAAWLAAACGSPCRNLDTFLMSNAAIGSSVAAAAAAGLLLLEGNRGLFDGCDTAGTHSTAELAKRLAAPLLLVVNVTKMTRTTAALVLGCCRLDPQLPLAGVILNRVGTSRQERLVRQAVEEATGVPVVGAIPRLAGDDPLPGRHLGLVTVAEHPACQQAIERAAETVERYVDLQRVLEIARQAPLIELPEQPAQPSHTPVTIGYFADEAFSFYYPENLEQLRAGGATLLAIAPRSCRELPQVDALYIGGGFPEEHAASLAGCSELNASLRRRVATGLPVYAECGGLMYLARELVVDGVSYPMAGVLDLVVEQGKRPSGHGYEVVRVDRDNLFFPRDSELTGHEFHYSRAVAGNHRQQTVLAVQRGQGLGGGRDGIVHGSVWASYLHLHALATPLWAERLLQLAASYARGAGATSTGTAAWA